MRRTRTLTSASGVTRDRGHGNFPLVSVLVLWSLWRSSCTAFPRGPSLRLRPRASSGFRVRLQAGRGHLLHDDRNADGLHKGRRQCLERLSGTLLGPGVVADSVLVDALINAHVRKTGTEGAAECLEWLSEAGLGLSTDTGGMPINARIYAYARRACTEAAGELPRADVECWLGARRGLLQHAG